ncbi:MAG: TonB-dependent receptor plug domain-containing protein, partial [Desulfobacterales bacterium]|nr:TonB-dependent receptor plug domain-containing protein [Desulfobacterales bacterium]
NKSKGKKFTLRMAPTSFDMKEVVIVAQRGKNINTSTTLGNAAIEHVQPTSLGDILQLLPGNLALNPDLSRPQQLAIREIGSDINSALGTAVIIDGAPISNDGNLQGISTALSSESGTGRASTVAGKGIDLRGIPTENIESIEIIKGIPSVVYGDLTSGAVVVKTKAGRAPLNLKVKTDPKIKQFAVGKGFLLSENSSLNFDMEFLKSHQDLRSTFDSYDRLTGSIAWSKTFSKGNNPLSFNVKYSYFKTIDESKTDPDAMTNDEEYKAKENGSRINIHGTWQLNKKLATNIKYSFSLSTTHQENYQKRYRSSSGLVGLSLAKVPGENIGIYLPSEQLTELTIDGRPLNIFGQITARKVNNFK